MFSFGKELRVKSINSLPHTIPTVRKKALENTVGKGENAGNFNFILIPQCFLHLSH